MLSEHCVGSDVLCLLEEFAPSKAVATVDNVIALEDEVGQRDVARELPDVFD